MRVNLLSWRSQNCFLKGSFLTFLLCLAAGPTCAAAADLPPTAIEGFSYDREFFPGADYDPQVPTPGAVLGFELGRRAANTAEIERCLKAWDDSSDRTRLVEYARSHEQRPLHYMIVTAPENLARLDEIRSGLERLSDPRRTTDAEAAGLSDTLPAVAWLAYTIHGDETEGSDAALSVLYHLTAARGAEVEQLLRDLVIIIDPVMNPDGRDRFLKMVAEHRGTSPNLDDASLVHSGYWPWGRMNHYLFDLNRDWIFAVHPETRGRIREVARWHPLLFVDAHGMGAQDTHLFSPPREPMNLHFPKSRTRWGEVFAKDQARALDEQGWLYYHGEWNEGWYPGYSDAWAVFRGAVGILYEQARVAEDGVRRPGGRILTYRESVHHHVVGSMANLKTLRANRRELLEQFHAERKASLAADGAYANRTFAILPTKNASRLNRFLELMRLQGFEVYRAGKEFTVSSATDQLGREVKGRTIPEGTVLIPNRQPLAPLVAAMLEFDPRIPAAALEDERRELLRTGSSRIYDTTAWNLTMLYGLEALQLTSELPESATAITELPGLEGGVAAGPENPVAYVIDGASDLSVTAAARLMERGVEVRVAEKPFTLDQQSFARGSVVIARLDNRGRPFAGLIASTVRELRVRAVPVGNGLGAGDLPDLGGSHFVRMEPPRIAVLGRGKISAYDFGSTWWVLDHVLGVRHSHLDESSATQDLRRYNVIILPDRWGGNLAPAFVQELKNWVRAGGTLIGVGDSAVELTTEKNEFSKVRPLPQVLGRLAEYEQAVWREWLAREAEIPGPDAVWAHKATPSLAFPWRTGSGSYPDEKELKKRDEWLSLFMPQGAIVGARADSKHWLTAGSSDLLPALVGSQSVLMAAAGVETPVRLGYLTKSATPPSPSAAVESDGAKGGDKGDKGDKKETPRVGWSALPEGTELYLRMSGLLWPEATHRLANSAWLTRERFGRGQIILFASPPTLRGATIGQMRLFLNAIVCGPGFGTIHPIQP